MQMSLYNAYSWPKLSAVRWRAKLHSFGTLQVQHRILHLCEAVKYSKFPCHQTTATKTSMGYIETLWSLSTTFNSHLLYKSKFQLSLKPTIYKLLLYAHLLEYVTRTYAFLQWHGDGRLQIVHIPLIRGAYTLHVHLHSTLMYYSFTSFHFSFFLLTVYKNGLKTSKKQHPLLVQIIVLSSVSQAPQI